MEPDNKLGAAERQLVIKGLGVMKAQIERAKTKEAADADMVAIYDKRLFEIQNLQARILSGSLF